MFLVIRELLALQYYFMQNKLEVILQTDLSESEAKKRVHRKTVTNFLNQMIFSVNHHKSKTSDY